MILTRAYYATRWKTPQPDKLNQMLAHNYYHENLSSKTYQQKSTQTEKKKIVSPKKIFTEISKRNHLLSENFQENYPYYCESQFVITISLEMKLRNFIMFKIFLVRQIHWKYEKEAINIIF